METLFFQIVGAFTKSRDGKYIAVLLVFGVFWGGREIAHAQEKDSILIKEKDKTEAMLNVCEKEIANKIEVNDALKEKIAELKLEIALCKLK
jgi:hypothetical protein